MNRRKRTDEAEMNDGEPTNSRIQNSSTTKQNDPNFGIRLSEFDAENEEEEGTEEIFTTQQQGEEDIDDRSESLLSGSGDEKSWIQWYTELAGHELLCVVDDDYIQDDFNLTGLNKTIPYYEQALDTILDIEIPIENFEKVELEQIEMMAMRLYGLIHARYILTTRGMAQMDQKYQESIFGMCPRVLCEGERMLPIGMSDWPLQFSMNVFCPRCLETYFYKIKLGDERLDGACFGTTFPHLFLLLHPEYAPVEAAPRIAPQVYGFKIHKDSDYFKFREPHPNGHAQGKPATIAPHGDDDNMDYSPDPVPPSSLPAVPMTSATVNVNYIPVFDPLSNARASSVSITSSALPFDGTNAP